MLGLWPLVRRRLALMHEPLPPGEDCVASPKKRKLNHNDGLVEKTASINAHPQLTAEQVERIEQNRRAALARKQGLTVEQMEKIEQNRRAAMARRQGVVVDAPKEAQEVAASDLLSCSSHGSVVLEKVKVVEEVPVPSLVSQQHYEDKPSSASPASPESDAHCSNTSSCAAQDSDSDGSDSVSLVDSTSSSSTSSSCSESDSDTASSSSSDSDADEEPVATGECKAALTVEQREKIEQNRKLALARKSGLTQEQMERIEENRRAAIARRKGLSEEQIRRMEENRRAAIARKKRQIMEESAEEPSQSKDKPSAIKEDTDEMPPPKVRDAKENIVAKLLCRWWYALPPWPPKDMDYEAELTKQRCRRVPVACFGDEPEFDERGFAKVYELSTFPGIFRTADGKMLDLRPQEGKPSYNEMMKKSKQELYRLLIKAYDAQLMDLFTLSNARGGSKESEEFLAQVRKEAAEVRQKAGFFLMFTKK